MNWASISLPVPDSPVIRTVAVVTATERAWSVTRRSAGLDPTMPPCQPALPSRSEERRVGKECRSLCDWSSDVCSSDLQDGRGGYGDGAGLVGDAAQRRTRSDYAALPAGFAKLIAEVDVVLFERVMVGRAPDDDLDFVDVERFMEKVVSASLYYLERGLPVFVAGDNYDRQQRVEFARRFKNGQPLDDVRFDGRHAQ